MQYNRKFCQKSIKLLKILFKTFYFYNYINHDKGKTCKEIFVQRNIIAIIRYTIAETNLKDICLRLRLKDLSRWRYTIPLRKM